MSRLIRMTAMAAVGAMLFTTGCATKGQLRRGLEAQRAELEAERRERIAGDQRLAGEMGVLNTDLAGLRNDYGVRIAQLEEGLEFAVPVHFAFNTAEVEQDVRPALDRFVELAQRHYPGAMITVEGFADPAGSAKYNRRLSHKRAEAVRNYLVSKGLPASQLRAVGYGEERLVVPGAAGNVSGAELNRRVVFVVETPEAAAVKVTTRATGRWAPRKRDSVMRTERTGGGTARRLLPPGAHRRRPLVLLVEDDADCRTINRTILRLSGYAVIEATNGTDGLRLARQCAPDLVLMDLEVPGTNGWAATRILREQAETAAIPVIALTGNVFPEHEARAREAGCVAFLTKPIMPRAIVAQIRSILGPHS